MNCLRGTHGIKDVLNDFGYVRLHEKLWEDLILSYTDTLEREDKLTMAHSIELRAPLSG